MLGAIDIAFNIFSGINLLAYTLENTYSQEIAKQL